MIGGCHQVLVYHTSALQIAAMADIHFEIEKHQKGTETITEIHPLDKEESVRELARLLGGARDHRGCSSERQRNERIGTGT